jgi:hypothetical protein
LEDIFKNPKALDLENSPNYEAGRKNKNFTENLIKVDPEE